MLRTWAASGKVRPAKVAEPHQFSLLDVLGAEVRLQQRFNPLL